MTTTDHFTEAPPSDSELMAARLATIVANSDDAIISKTLDGTIMSWNGGATRIFGYEPEEIIGKPITTIIPSELAGEEREIISRLTRGERIEHFETVRVAKDGRRVDISLTVSPMRDSAGRIIGASKVARDIGDRKRAEQTQRLLIDELNHRIKNTLATVQAIATQTLRRASSPGEFVQSFNGRINALARAHALLTGSSFQSAEITDLVREQLLFGNEEDRRISWSGPAVTLEAQPALHLALVLHELGTNARKHGALSQVAGSLAVRWIVQSQDGRSIRISWCEAGGPPVSAPTSRGFGSVLIQDSLRAHGGEVVTCFSEAGFSCEIILPLPLLHHAIGGATQDSGLAKPPLRPNGEGLAGKRILIVEDEPLIAMVLSDFLEDARCTVVGPAQSPERASQLAQCERLDAALVDGNLAGRPVDQIVAQLRDRRIPFVFVTGYGRDALPSTSQDAPIVEKPFTKEQVLGALARLVDASR